MLRLWIDTTGAVREVELFQADHPIFVAPSLAAVRQWRFRPAMKDGRPVAVWMMLPVRFRQRRDTPPAAPAVSDSARFVLSLPDGFLPLRELPEMRQPTSRGYTSASPATRQAVLVFETHERLPLLPDTSVAYRLRFLEQLVGPLLDATEIEALDSAAYRVTPTRLTARVHAQLTQPGGPAIQSLTDITLPRQGDAGFVVAQVLGPTRADVDTPEAQRLLDGLAFRPASVDSTALTRLTGTWQWTEGSTGMEPAVREPFTLTVAPDRQTLLFAYTAPAAPEGGDPQRAYTYRVLGLTSRAVRARIEGETRLNEAGAPLTWDFVWQDDGTFCWHEASWPDEACTVPLTRVPPEGAR